MGHSLNLQRFFLCVLLTASSWSKAEVAPRKVCGVNRECLPRYLCDGNQNVVVDGHNLIDYRSRGNGCDWLEECCSVSKKVNGLSNKAQTSLIKPTFIQQKVDVDIEYETRGCGHANPQGVGLTIRNPQRGEANFAEFPWMVLVLEEASIANGWQHKSLGGGSLLAPNVVLTAAHIIKSQSNELLARAGEWDTKSVGEPLRHQDRAVTTTIIHEHFNNLTAFNDIALLLLDVPFKMGKHIDTICLPSPGFQIDESNCVSTGWGKKEFTNDYYAHVMKKIQLPLVEHSKCQQMLRATRLGPYFRLHSSFICAGGEEGRNTCTGDGGGPLACPLNSDPNRYQLLGVVSWGLHCNDANVPGVYLDVTELKAWIMAQFKLYSIVIS